MHPFLETIIAKFPEAVITAEQDPVRGDLWAQVKADQWRHIAQFLHDDPRLALDHITDICAADYPDDLERFEVIYQFLSLPHGTRLGLNHACRKSRQKLRRSAIFGAALIFWSEKSMT